MKQHRYKLKKNDLYASNNSHINNQYFSNEKNNRKDYKNNLITNTEGNIYDVKIIYLLFISYFLFFNILVGRNKNK